METNLQLGSKKTIAKLLDAHKNLLEAKNITLKETTVLSLISKAKAKGQDADDFLPTPSTSQSRRPLNPGLAEANDIKYIVSQVYREYERTLRQNNCLDFDDLLVFGVKLFSMHPTSVAWCRHVLVDEL
jgi:DNA helicase-2/ATP-dependent DNA helicase PcrA